MTTTELMSGSWIDEGGDKPGSWFRVKTMAVSLESKNTVIPGCKINYHQTHSEFVVKPEMDCQVCVLKLSAETIHTIKYFNLCQLAHSG